MKICYIIPPRREGFQTKNFSVRLNEDYLPECILPYNHYCQHVFKTPNGIYVGWEDDWSCDCCAPDEEDRCIIYGELTKKEFEELIKT